MDNRQEINLIGGGFQHSVSTSGFEPLFIKWVKGIETSPISIYVDDAIRTHQVNSIKKNYGWLSESKTIKLGIYDWCENNIEILKNKFISVFTHDKQLALISDIFVLTQCSGKSFLPSSDAEIYNKTDLVSIIVSNKKICAEHLFRHTTVEKYGGKCDLYGRGFNELPNKLDGLKKYCFSFAMENATYPNMFTEKITDCFVTGTIPIYYGINNIGDFFNEEGIITLDDEFRFEDLSFELYEKKRDAIKDNFNIANNMLVAEDYIYVNFIKNEI